VSSKADEGLSAFAALFLFALTFVLMLGMPLVFSAISAAVHDVPLSEGARQVGGSLATLTLIQLLAMAVPIAAGLKLLDLGQPLSDLLALRPIRSRSLLLCLAAGMCLQFPLAELANQLHHHLLGIEPLDRQLAKQALIEAHSPLAGALVVLCLVALIPATEELLFRGLLMFHLARRYGAAFGILLSACLFGAIHREPVAVVYAAAAGLVLGALAHVTRSVWASIALHAAVNAVPVLLPESLWPIHGFNVPSELPQHLPLWLVLPLLSLAFYLLLWVRRLEAAEVRDD
jgi:membrane protease YdiL (CAAX protease family)